MLERVSVQGLRVKLTRILLAGLAGMLFNASAAQAAWMEARSAHFIVIGNGRPVDIEAMATELEQFDSVIRRFHGVADDKSAQANPLTVYVVGNSDEVARYCHGCPAEVAGFYEGRASGSVAWTPKRSGSGEKTDLKPRQVLFHEYGHHFLLGNYGAAYPPWFTEGYAEFVATITNGREGYTIGSPPLYRAWGLITGTPLSAEDLFDPTRLTKMNAEKRDVLYGRGWLLTHYLILDPERIKKLHKYLGLLNSGTPSLDAAKQAFGDLGQLDKDLNRYLAARYIGVVRMKSDSIPAPHIETRVFTPGQSIMIPFRMQSRSGVDGTTAKPLYAKAAVAAAPYADDAVVQGWLSEMALDAGDIDAALADADRALKIDPKQTQALIYLGRARMAALSKTPGDAAAWSKARLPIIQANRSNPDNAEPLMLYYQSFNMEGRAPPPIAVDGLLRAVQLVPQDEGLRFLAVEEMVKEKKTALAMRLLRPLAYDPHRPADNPAAQLLATLSEDEEQAQAPAKGDAKDVKSADKPSS